MVINPSSVAGGRSVLQAAGGRNGIIARGTACSQQEHQLRRWIVKNGGFVHDRLCLTDDAPCGTRGVVAMAGGISLEDLLETPLVLGTLCAELASPAAKPWLMPEEELAESLKQLEQQQQQQQQQLQQSRNSSSSSTASSSSNGGSSSSRTASSASSRGPSSGDRAVLGVAATHAGWQVETPQALTLQNGFSCDRGLGVDTMQQTHTTCSCDEGYSSRLHGWRAAVKSTRARFEGLAAEVLDICGPALGLDMEDMLWGLGQVSSRSLGSGSSSGLVPYLDLLNHSEEARPPMLQLDDDDRLVMTCTNIRDGELHALKGGEELYLSYGSWDSAQEAWLKFGFVPRRVIIVLLLRDFV